LSSPARPATVPAELSGSPRPSGGRRSSYPLCMDDANPAEAGLEGLASRLPRVAAGQEERGRHPEIGRVTGGVPRP